MFAGMERSKCDQCRHKEVCRHVEAMEAFEMEVKRSLEKDENKTFRVDFGCRNFMDEKAPVFQPSMSMRSAAS